MFRVLTPPITLAAVLTHAVLGCCVHHVHAGEALGHGSVAVAAHAECHGDLHGHGPHDERHVPGHDSEQDVGCHESDCSWLTAPYQTLPVLPPASFGAAADAALTVVVGSPCSARPSWTGGSGFRDGPGSRLRTRVFLL